MSTSALGLPINLPRGTDLAPLVEIAIRAQDSPRMFTALQEGTTSCCHWATALSKLMDMKTDPIYRSIPQQAPNAGHLNQIEEALNRGEALFTGMKLPTGGDHFFIVESLNKDGRPRFMPGNWEGDHARVIQAWQNDHQAQVSKTIPIRQMKEDIGTLGQLDWTDRPQIDQAKPILKRLFGARHAEKLCNAALSKLDNNNGLARPTIEFTEIRSGVPRQSFVNAQEFSQSITEGFERLQLSESSPRSSNGSDTGRASWRTVSSDLENTPTGGKISIRGGAAVGAGIGFVLGAGISWWKSEAPEDIGLAGLKSGLGGGVGGAVGAAVAKNVTPTFARAGASIFRSNAATGVAMSAIFTIWDVTEWKMHKITGVQLRQRLAEGLTGAAAGAGGAGLGALIGSFVFPGIGTVIGGIVGGIGAGIGGSLAGGAIDGAVWDKSEDSIMNAYEFFQWHNVSRNKRPKMTADQITKAFDNAFENKRPKETKQEDWHKVCLANFMVLIRAMYPEIAKILQESDRVYKYIANNPGTGPILEMLHSFTDTETESRWSRKKCRFVASSGGLIPSNAVRGGEDQSGETLYIGRAMHQGSKVPGKLHPSHGVVYVSWGGKEHAKRDYEVLVQEGGINNLHWQSASHGSLVSTGAVLGGYEANGNLLYIGRAMVGNRWIPGKISTQYKMCYVPYDGKEHGKTNYQVLCNRS